MEPLEPMVQLTVAGDVTEAEQIEEILRVAGIEPRLESSDEADAVKVLVPEAELEAAEEAIEALSEPDDSAEEA
jgi:hypothetical protein